MRWCCACWLSSSFVRCTEPGAALVALWLGPASFSTIYLARSLYGEIPALTWFLGALLLWRYTLDTPRSHFVAFFRRPRLRHGRAVQDHLSVGGLSCLGRGVVGSSRAPEGGGAASGRTGARRRGTAGGLDSRAGRGTKHPRRERKRGARALPAPTCCLESNPSWRISSRGGGIIRFLI